jgi:hypothetical protein
MIITQFDHPTTAEEARQISLANKDDSRDRSAFRTLMGSIRESASMGYTRYQSMPSNADWTPSEHVCKALRSMGYAVTVKRAYLYDDKKNGWSDKPWLDGLGREQFFVEVTWG